MVLLKIPPIITKTMITGQWKQAPEDRQALRTYWTQWRYGVEEPREAFVESEDEQEQRTT